MSLLVMPSNNFSKHQASGWSELAQIKNNMVNPTEKASPKNYKYVQWVAVLSAFILSLQMGIYTGWSSPNFAWLLSKESSIQATTYDVSWIASLAPAGHMVGAIVGSICIEYIGSRRTILLALLLIGIHWTCLLIANSVEWIYAARFIGGVPSVMAHVCFPMYLGEISSPEIRGTLISLALTGSPVGTVLSTVAETYLPMKVSNSIYLATVLIATMSMLWLKDTPYFLIKKNDLDGAKQSVEFYHTGKETDRELETIKFFVEQSKSQNLKDKFRRLQSPVIMRSMLATFIIWGLVHLSGYGILITYMEIILKSAQFDLVKPQEFVIYTTIMIVLVAFVAAKFVDKLGRKLMLLISSVGASIFMFALGLHFHLISRGFDGKSLQWLPFASIIMFLIICSVGFGTVPVIIISEMFPEDMKSSAFFVSSISTPIFGFVVTKAYQSIVDFAGQQYAFWIHSLLSLTGIPCTIFLMIETKGKSFQEIQTELIKKWHI